MRRSISRISSVYWLMVRRSAGPSSFVRLANCPTMESRMLRFWRIRAVRTSGVAPLPNSRSNTFCGLSSIGSGLVCTYGSFGGVGTSIHEIEFVYEQLYPSPQLLELEFGSSHASCSDGSSVSWPILRAMI
jgi:hypothetical protein